MKFIRVIKASVYYFIEGEGEEFNTLKEAQEWQLKYIFKERQEDAQQELEYAKESGDQEEIKYAESQVPVKYKWSKFKYGSEDCWSFEMYNKDGKWINEDLTEDPNYIIVKGNTNENVKLKSNEYYKNLINKEITPADGRLFEDTIRKALEKAKEDDKEVEVYNKLLDKKIITKDTLTPRIIDTILRLIKVAFSSEYKERFTKDNMTKQNIKTAIKRGHLYDLLKRGIVTKDDIKSYIDVIPVYNMWDLIKDGTITKQDSELYNKALQKLINDVEEWIDKDYEQDDEFFFDLLKNKIITRQQNKLFWKMVREFIEESEVYGEKKYALALLRSNIITRDEYFKIKKQLKED